MYEWSCNLFDVISVYSLNPGKLPGRFSYKRPGYEATGAQAKVGYGNAQGSAHGSAHGNAHGNAHGTAHDGKLINTHELKMRPDPIVKELRAFHPSLLKTWEG